MDRFHYKQVPYIVNQKPSNLLRIRNVFIVHATGNNKLVGFILKKINPLKVSLWV